MDGMPKPIFIHHDIDGGATCVSVITLSGKYHMAVGTAHGQCILYSLKTHLPTAVVYGDSKRRRIIAFGQLSEETIFIHVRAHAVYLFRVDAAEQEVGCVIMRKLPTEHCGFCEAVPINGRLYYPLYRDGKEMVNAVSCTNEEVAVVSSSLKNCCLMRISPSKLDFLLCCYENGTAEIVDTLSQSVTDMKVAFLEPILACDVYENAIAMSSVKTPFKLYRVENKKFIGEKTIDYPQRSGGCSELCFSPNGKELASGYWDGSLRIHYITTGTLRAVIDFHSETINSMCWTDVAGRRLLHVCSKDKKISVWNLYKD